MDVSEKAASSHPRRQWAYSALLWSQISQLIPTRGV